MIFFKHNQGLTLIELLVGIGIFLLVVVGLSAILSSGFYARSVVWEQLSTQKEGRQIIQDFTNELRSAAVSSIGAYPLETAESDQIIFYSNIDGDSWREKIRYFLSGGVLKKGVTKPSGSPLVYTTSTEIVSDMIHDVINGTSTPVFYYYDENYKGDGDALVDPVDTTQVRMVGIKLILEENPNLSPAPLQIEAKAHVRNLKSN